jgi:hypothetical protein
MLQVSIIIILEGTATGTGIKRFWNSDNIDVLIWVCCDVWFLTIHLATSLLFPHIYFDVKFIENILQYIKGD